MVCDGYFDLLILDLLIYYTYCGMDIFGIIVNDNSHNTMQMNQQWMYNADRRSKEFIDGLHYFLDVAEANKQNGFMCCPCGDCQNQMDYSSSKGLLLFKDPS